VIGTQLLEDRRSRQNCSPRMTSPIASTNRALQSTWAGRRRRPAPPHTLCSMTCFKDSWRMSRCRTRKSIALRGQCDH